MYEPASEQELAVGSPAPRWVVPLWSQLTSSPITFYVMAFANAAARGEDFQMHVPASLRWRLVANGAP